MDGEWTGGGFCRDCFNAVRGDDRRCPLCRSPRLLRHPELHRLTTAHLDCDAFYAAIEKRDDPGLRDKPVIVGEVRWPGPMTVDWWRWTQALTDRPVKGMLTGPYTMMDWSFDDHYPNRRAACLALARELRKELAALLEAGARIVQIDEPALSVRPAELPFAVEALHEMVDGLPAYYVSHACFGAFEAIYPGLLDLPVDNLDLAISHTALDLLGMFGTAPFTKDLSLGVLDVHTHAVEPPAEVKARIMRGVTVLPAERIWVDPDCGLKTRTVDETRAKLAVMMTAVREVRATLG